jgi:7-cyano-7-deazaguanine synthase
MSSLLLFSGGIDSAAVAYWKRPDLLLHIDYGQLAASGELRAARVIAKRINIPLKELRADCSAVGSGDLVGSQSSPCAPSSSWWPFRNQLLATLGAAVAVNSGIETLMIATVTPDRMYRDGSNEFIVRFREVLAIQEGTLGFEAPSIELTTSQLVQKSRIPCSILAWSYSCHLGSSACGRCRGCLNRYNTLRALCL